jgi:hypothetical protein
MVGVSPDNARERAKNEKTRTVSSFSHEFLRKPANSVAETVQFFGRFPAGKVERRKIAVDLDAVGICEGRTATTPPQRPANNRSAGGLPGVNDGQCPDP